MKPEQKFKSSEAEIPQDWLFTFGYSHPHPNTFVRIHGTMNSAREEMLRRYGSKWSFQYPRTEKQEQELKRYFMTELKE